MLRALQMPELAQRSFWNSSNGFQIFFTQLRGDFSMTAKRDIPPMTPSGKPPYSFRTGWALLLLAINFVVAAYYFGILK